MGEYTAADGTTFTDADVERWGAEAEEGFAGWNFGKPVPGRPISVGAEARPFTLRLDAARRAKLQQVAAKQNTTASQIMRDLIDAL